MLQLEREWSLRGEVHETQVRARIVLQVRQIWTSSSPVQFCQGLSQGIHCLARRQRERERERRFSTEDRAPDKY